MDRAAARLHAGFGNLWMLDASNWSITCEDESAISAFTGLDCGTVDRYKKHYASVNVWLPRALNLAEGSITVSSELYPDHLLKDTEFHDLFLRPNDLFYALGSSVAKRGTTDVRLSFVRSRRAGRYEETELDLMRQLMPHLRNAVVLHRELHRTRLLAASAMAALERLPVGVLLLCGQGRLAHANRRAVELCASTGALRFGPAGALQGASPATSGSLQRLVRDAVQTSAGKGHSSGGTLQLKGAGGRRLHLLVTPLPRQPELGVGAMAAIFCSDPDARVGVLWQRLEALYGMSPAEARLTEALVNGRSLIEYADARRVTINTVRTQLKSAAAKAGVKRQADLVRIVLTGPAIFQDGGGGS